MLIVYMMGIYLAAILALSLLTHFTSLRVTKVRQTFKHLALANTFGLMGSVVVGSALNVPASWQFAVYKPLLTLAFSILIYGKSYSRQLRDSKGELIPPKLGYLIAGANFSIILLVGLTLVYTVSYFKLS